MQVPSYPYYLANEPVEGKEQLDVTDKYSGQVAYRVSVASPEEISRCAAIVTKSERGPAPGNIAEACKHSIWRFGYNIQCFAMAQNHAQSSGISASFDSHE